MIISDEFVFAHLPKTGGDFLQNVLRDYFPVVQQWQGDHSHHSIEFLPAEHRGKPVFAVLRNPWAWYLSWYSYCLAEGHNDDFRLNYRHGPNAFRDCIQRLLAPNHTDPHVNDYMARENIGLFEMHRYHILDLDCPDHEVHYGRLEFLREDFMEFLNRSGIAAPAGLYEALGQRARNTSRHVPWQEAYDPELFRTVAEKERRIVRLGQYSDIEESCLA